MNKNADYNRIKAFRGEPEQVSTWMVFYSKVRDSLMVDWVTVQKGVVGMRVSDKKKYNSRNRYVMIGKL